MHRSLTGKLQILKLTKPACCCNTRPFVVLVELQKQIHKLRQLGFVAEWCFVLQQMIFGQVQTLASKEHINLTTSQKTHFGLLASYLGH